MPEALDPRGLARYVAAQLRAVTPDDGAPSAASLEPLVESALSRTMQLIAQISAKRYRSAAGTPSYSHLHAGQHAMFLYKLGREALLAGNTDLATRTYLLNRAFHSIDLMYDIELPSIFYWEHPIGTVLGRASYGDYFSCYQHCTVGGNLQLEYPTIGEDVTLFAGAVVLGRSVIGARVKVSAGSRIIDEEVPGDSVVSGSSPHLTIRPLADGSTRARWFR